MITRRTKIQLLVFVVITLLGVAYVGARYARLDKLVHNTDYTVVAHFKDSGGIFAGAEVTYRGVTIGQVDKLELRKDGVDVYLHVEKKWDKIPADTRAIVGNRSAVGEQYVELLPQVDDGPYLKDDSQIALADTEIPIATDKLLTDISDTVSSVGKADLHTTVEELGKAFAGTGIDLQRLIDTSNSFLKEADANFDVTTQLIRDANTVLKTQLGSESAIREFAGQLSAFTDTLVDADPDLRKVIDSGSFAADQLRSFIEEHRIDLAHLLNNVTNTGRILVKRIPGLEQVLVIYPYVVEGGFTVVDKSPSGLYDAHFGLVLTLNSACTNGYQGTKQRSPSDRFDNPDMNVNAGCVDPPNKRCTGAAPIAPQACNARGAQNAPPRVAPRFGAGASGRVVASYDAESGKVTWGERIDPDLAAPDTVAPSSLGKESWKWLYLQPMVGQ